MLNFKRGLHVSRGAVHGGVFMDVRKKRLVRIGVGLGLLGCAAGLLALQMDLAGQMARCLAKHLQRAGAQVAAFLHVNPQKYGTQLHGAPVLPATILPELHGANPQQLILVAVAAAGPRAIILSRLAGWNLRETIDF